jgi:hypothetical protein
MIARAERRWLHASSPVESPSILASARILAELHQRTHWALRQSCSNR